VSDFFKSNQRAAWIIVGAFAVLLLTSALAACQVEDWVKVKVPTGVQQAIETEPSIPVSQTEAEWNRWVAYVERESDRFANAIEQGKQTSEVIRTLTAVGIQIGQDAASTLPGGALLSSGLALLGGLFLRRPGDATREAKEKEASYNAGLERGLQDALKALGRSETPAQGDQAWDTEIP
jgi:hypothetical protein